MVSDAVAISELVAELGYPAASTEIPQRLVTLEESGRAMAMVAELDGRVVGLLTAHTLSTLHQPVPVAWITTLVVSEQTRGSGAGRELVRAAEAWAREAGASRIAVTSGAQRTDAHEFYRRIGYAQTGIRFGKILD